MKTTITIIKEGQARTRYLGSQGRSIIFEGKKRISFGISVKNNRRYYLIQAVKSLIHKSKWQ